MNQHESIFISVNFNEDPPYETRDNVGIWCCFCVLQTEMLYKRNPKLLNQFQYSEREGVPLLVIVGEEETVKGGVKIRDTHTREEVNM